MRHACPPRTLLTGLAVPVAVAAATGGTVLAAGPAAASARDSAATACTVTWTGGGATTLWTNAQNWSTGQVPGSASDVCMSPFAFVTARGPIQIHSLHVGPEMTVTFTGTSSQPSRVRIATVVDNLGNVQLDNSSLTVPRFVNGNGIQTQGTSVLTSPALTNTGDVTALSGSLTLPDSLGQLSNGTLSGGSWSALANGTLVLPGDITSLTSGQVGLGQNSQIDDPAGHNALSGLASIGTRGAVQIAGSSLALAGGLVSNGTIDLGSYAGGGALTVAGTLTQRRGGLSMRLSTLTARKVVIGLAARLTANGTIAGSLVNDGVVAVAGQLPLSGNYTQAPGATLAAGFGGELKVTGTAALAGGLLSAAPVPDAAPGTRATAITFSSASGNFTSHALGFPLQRTAHEVDVIATPQIAVSPASAAPGGQVTVTGADFGYQTTVTLFLDRVGGTVLGTAQPDVQGAFTVGATIPSSATAGSHTVIAVGSDGRQAQATLTVS
jgi:hypothetical protein